MKFWPLKLIQRVIQKNLKSSDKILQVVYIGSFTNNNLFHLNTAGILPVYGNRSVTGEKTIKKQNKIRVPSTWKSFSGLPRSVGLYDVTRKCCS